MLQRDTVSDMHTTVHTLRTKDHTLIIGQNIQRVIILSGHDPNPAADVETPICMPVAEIILTRPRTKKV